MIYLIDYYIPLLNDSANIYIYIQSRKHFRNYFQKNISTPNKTTAKSCKKCNILKTNHLQKTCMQEIA